MTWKLCRVCGHAKWHDVAQAPLNPVALIGWIERTSDHPDAARIVQYILAVTGINRAEMDAVLKAEQAQS